MTIQEAKSYGKSALSSSPSPALDTNVLLQHITGLDKTHLLLNRDQKLTGDQESLFLSFIEKRKTGLPIAYITHEKEFYGRIFYVDESVLIPKPDTEILIDLAVQAALKMAEKKNGGLKVCDLCSGSGCIGISFISEFENAVGKEKADETSLTFIDISKEALGTTRKNAERLLTESQLTRSRFVQSDLFDGFDRDFSDSKEKSQFDLILTNPPYIPSSEASDLLKDGRSEPLLALDGLSEDGLGIIRRLLPQARAHMAEDGQIFMETGEYNAKGAAAIMKECGFSSISIAKDLNQMDRVVCAVNHEVF